MKRRAIDATTDFGTPPRGLAKTPGLCNYQWAIEGPLGAVVFYCANPEPCDGVHLVKFGAPDEEQYVTLSWSSLADLVARRVAQQL